MKISIHSEKKLVIEFLDQLRTLLKSPDFSIAEDLILIKSKKSKEKEIYSTPYTLLDLNYNAEDIVERLKELKYQEYHETLFDKNDANPPLLFVFGKKINGRLVYIKIKIKKGGKHKVLCLSFHYAEYLMEYPYT